MPAKKFVPPKKRMNREPRPVITEQEYRKRLEQKQRIPRGTKVKLKPAKPKTTEELEIKFHSDGSMEIPVYAGKEASLKIARMLRPKTIPEGVRLVYHQIESVKTRTGQAQKIFDEVSRLQWSLQFSWKKFSPEQKKAFTEYFTGILGQLVKNPLLVSEEQKLNAITRFEEANSLLRHGNHTAASASIRGIKNDMLDWKRKLSFQEKYLKRRGKAVAQKKFEKDTKLFSAIDLLRNVLIDLKKPSAGRRRNIIADKISKASKKLFFTGLKAFKEPAIILEKAAELVNKGEFAKAREYIRNANRKAVAKASEISPIYPDKLSEIKESRDSAFKKTVLSNQAALFYDMIPFWWPKQKTAVTEQKKRLILSSVKELSLIAESLGRKQEAGMLSKALNALNQSNPKKSREFFFTATEMLDSELAKKLL